MKIYVIAFSHRFKTLLALTTFGQKMMDCCQNFDALTPSIQPNLPQPENCKFEIYTIKNNPMNIRFKM